MHAAARITAPQGDAMAKRPRGPDRRPTVQRQNGDYYKASVKGMR